MKNDMLARRFVHHHMQNPERWKTYEETILDAINSGTSRGGIKAVTEKIRWNLRQHLINDYDPFYSRLFAFTHTEHSDFFQYKESAADYIDYEKLIQGDVKGALNWDDPQLFLPLLTD
jgi:hypothetical protein